MRHPDEGTIHAWLDGALDDADAAWLETHARECAACGALVAEARGLVAGASRVLGALDGVPGGVLPPARTPETVNASDPAPHDTAARTLRRSARARMLERPRWVMPARAAAALLLVAGGAAVVVRSADTPRMMATATDTAAITDASAPVVVALPPVVAR